MHELGVVIEIVKSVEDFARENGLARVGRLVLQVGELSAMIPRYIEACYPAAVEGSLLAETELSIEILPGVGRCPACAKVFRVLEHEGRCPTCGAADPEILSGRELLIKEIEAC